MASRIRFIRTALSTSALVITAALFGGSVPASADPASAGQPDPVLSAGLRTLASEFGDSNGHIVIRNSDGSSRIFARDDRGFQIYTAGDEVASDDPLAMCEQTSSGELSACEVLSAPGGEGTAYECDWDESSSWCTCDGFYDCLAMIQDGPCDSELSCGDVGICVCEA
jgi:hypothetical protein